jgi:superfamily II DNA/RNA helicase
LSFNKYRLSSNILKGLKDLKIDKPSPKHRKILDAVDSGSDLVINTNAKEKPEIGYLLKILNEIAVSERRTGTKAIIISNDAERAQQLDEWIWAVGYHAKIESANISIEGDPDEQMKLLSSGPPIVVATPERLASLLEEGRYIFREVHLMVIDQADQIENWDVINIITKRIIGKCQRIFTAEKDSKELRDAEKKYLTDPDLITQTKKKPEKQAITPDLTQYYINVPPRSKISTLMAHLKKSSAEPVVIFTASKRTADRLYKILRKGNLRAVSIHPALNESTLKERFERFSSNNVQHLIAGEFSANDLDINNVAQVINYDVPEDVDEYKLRAELVGDGKAAKLLSLVSKQDKSDIKTICNDLGYAPEEIPLPEQVKQKKNGRGKSKKSKSKNKPRRGKYNKHKREKKKTLTELPRPTYDKLSGGRSGKKDEEEEKSGIIGFIKKLFK